MKTVRTSGFTLVELVVVIAILAILAGISVPVYSGYIKKANEASDLQLLGAVNTAFAAACAERDGRRPSEISSAGAGIALDAGGYVRPIAHTPLVDAFFTYFGSNAEVPFERFTAIYYDADSGQFIAYDPVSDQFVGSQSDEIAISVPLHDADLTVRVKLRDLMAVSQSAFGDEEVVTVDQLMRNVQGVLSKSQFASAVIGSSGYQAFLTELAGDDAEMLEKLESEDANESNLLVFYAAQNTREAPGEEMLGSLAELYMSYDDGADPSQNDLTAEDVSDIALLYGLATAYAYRNHQEGDDPVSVRSVFTDPDSLSGFLTYLDSDEGHADMAGYVSCMNILNENMQADTFNQEDYYYITEAGYTAGDIVGALNTVLHGTDETPETGT